ncbi:MAG: SagB/ThcOx family dehydrogenase [Syntrophales bacterium]|jgi:SagB-type dehydrogenase family enzyme|nr:SagB/ThcOx family dehydrogenase [Syntrophales bacterium]MCK9528484.1 SagB/ThcOx family dehydrogenase [Syntrophales bacterium]MDX9923021.1 SagB/ThcOx family dehydrogenase [Syntrophales bacterium]
MNGSVISLPKPAFRGMILEEVLEQRRSVRRFSTRGITRAELGQLLFAGQGITQHLRGRDLRTAPSAGATYPLELYAVVHSVEGLPRGIYRYLPEFHSLSVQKQGDFADPLTRACLGQEWIETADVALVITAVPDRILNSYGNRSTRYIYMEAGHTAQNILLEAVSLGLGGVPIGAFRDGDVNNIMALDGERETVVYLVTLGTR